MASRTTSARTAASSASSISGCPVQGVERDVLVGEYDSIASGRGSQALIPRSGSEPRPYSG